MKKSNTNSLITSYIIKILISTLSSLFATVSISSYVVLKLDLDLKYCNTISIICACICSFVISFVSTFSFKNNGLLMGLMSICPLILYSFFTFLFGNNTIVLFLIKLVLCIIISAITGYISTNKNKRIKV